MRWLRHGLVAAASTTLPGCEDFALAPIELDVSTNCNSVEVVVTAAAVQSDDRPWHTVVAALADRPGLPGAWLLVVRTPGPGPDQLALLHVDDEFQVDGDVIIGIPPGLADQYTLVPGASPGSLFLVQRAPGTFYVRRYEASSALPLVASSPNLAAVAAPCDPDGDGLFESCDASSWFQALVFLDGDPFTVTLPPSSESFRVEVTPTPLDDFLGPSFPLDPGRTLTFAPRCDDELPEAEYEICVALYAERSYPRLAPIGLQRDLERGVAALALYRQIQEGTQPPTTADMPLLLLARLDGQTVGIPLIDPELPEPAADAPGGVVMDRSSTYVHYTARDGADILVRAQYSTSTLERLDPDFTFPTGAALAQLDEDVALHRVVDGNWEILKLFPDAPARSLLTEFSVPSGVDAVQGAGPGTFLVRHGDGTADLAHARCAVPEPE